MAEMTWDYTNTYLANYATTINYVTATTINTNININPTYPITDNGDFYKIKLTSGVKVPPLKVLKYLDLSHQPKQEIYQILSKTKMELVGSLNLSNCNLEDTDIIFLLTLSGIVNLEWLDISNNDLTALSLKYLCIATCNEALNLQFLNIFNNICEDPVCTFERDPTTQHIVPNSIKMTDSGNQLNQLHGHLPWIYAPNYVYKYPPEPPHKDNPLNN